MCKRLALFFLVTTTACGSTASTPGDTNGGVTTTTTGSAPSDPTPTTPSTGARAHRRCGWVFTNEPAGADFFVKNAASFDAIHPVWYALANDGSSLRTLADADDPVILEAAKKNHVAVIPLVASVEDVGLTRTMMNDPAKRAAHVKNIVDLAVQHGYDGIDIDYEHLWEDADHAPLMAFYQALSAALHAVGKSVSMAVPPIDGPSTVWDYGDLGNHLDQVHVMAYDFHVVGGEHAGATSPLGWVDAVAAQIAKSTSHPERFILGMPNYGMTTGAACDLGQCAAKCTSAAAPNVAEMGGCPSNPRHYDTGRVLSCPSAGGMQFFDDVTSITEKVGVARKYKFGGVAYWKLGNEPAGYLDALKL